VSLVAVAAAVGFDQDAAPLPTPCAESSSGDATARDALLAADLAAASHDEAKSADLLAEAARRGAGPPPAADLLALARREESRGNFAFAAAQYRQYAQSVEATGEDTRWVEPRARLLELAIRVAPGDAAPEARIALADGRAALSRGDRRAARERLGDALRLDSGYADAAIAAGALDAGDGRKADAVRDYRLALAAEPERVEAIVPLSNLLWEHPDRAAKAESLLLLDRAAAARPDLPVLRKRAAERYALWGDARAALERLDEWRAGANAVDRQQTDALRASLVSRLPPEAAKAGTDAEADAARRRPQPAAPRAETAGPGASPWLWGAAAAVFLAAVAAVLVRRRRPAAVEEPAEPVSTTTVVSPEELSRMLQSTAAERQCPPPLFLTKGFPDEERPPWVVRVSPPEWERIWRTVFGATLSGMLSARGTASKLALFGSLVHDSSIAGPAVRIALADNAPLSLTTEMIRGRSAGPDWAAVDEAIRANGGSIAVAASIDRQFTKRLLIELPAETQI